MIENYLKLVWAYLKIGLFGFGGGYAMLSLIQREVVDSGWITSQMFTDIVAISQMTPGPIGINSATYIGYVVTGSVLGSLVTTLTVVLPPFILTLIAAHYIERHKQSPFIKGAFMGLRPVVVGLIASAALLLMIFLTASMSAFVPSWAVAVALTPISAKPKRKYFFVFIIACLFKLDILFYHL
jgi:chromate transporter